MIEFPGGAHRLLYVLALVMAPEFNTELRQDIIAAGTEGRQALARTYAPRGINPVEARRAGVKKQQPVCVFSLVH